MIATTCNCGFCFESLCEFLINKIAWPRKLVFLKQETKTQKFRNSKHTSSTR